ncbi:MAG: DNA mismatch repair protein [Chlorobi bacterium]|nr:DNA mismatch repair protein [Chlorobiota bacterium]
MSMTTFGTDRQTLSDLNIFPREKGDLSVFSFFNNTRTKAGNNELAGMLRSPLNDPEKINARISAIKFILDNDLKCKLDNKYLDFIGYYLNHNIPVLKDSFLSSLHSWLSYKIKPTNDYFVISRGLDYLKNHIRILAEFVEESDSAELPEFFRQLKSEMEDIMQFPRFRFFIKPKKQKLSFRQLNRYDHLIRKKETERIKSILNLTGLLDAYLSVAAVAKEHKLAFPVLKETTRPQLKIDGLFHPFIKKPVKNDIELNGNSNLCFVTGANMAGKSTFLKTVGLCVYLAHAGFPVPARSMETSLFNGLYMTINIPDNLSKGYSHFYSEVKRVKDITVMIGEKKRIFVVFDELFRGTNVKDAFDATLMITKGFTRIKDSMFFISTQIAEVGHELKKLKKVTFKCFQSELHGETPVYNYRLTDGISTDRLGLTILKNEKIIELIDEIAKDIENN